MRVELTDAIEPKKGLTVKGGTKKGNIAIQIDGVSREVPAQELTRAVQMLRNSPEPQ